LHRNRFAGIAAYLSPHRLPHLLVARVCPGEGPVSTDCVEKVDRSVGAVIDAK
jgi:hypothetical protein